VGANISNMNFNKGVPAPVTPITAAWKPGITLGFLLRVPLGEKWLLQPEYSYTQRNGKDKSIDTDYQLDYFSLPLLLHYKVHPRISLYAGPQGELLVHATAKTSGIKNNITHDTEERSIAAIAGIELRVLESVFVSARYVNGFNHIGIGQRSAVKEFKYEGVSITAGVHF
jgi:opacity protein-like surface antigen